MAGSVLTLAALGALVLYLLRRRNRKRRYGQGTLYSAAAPHPAPQAAQARTLEVRQYPPKAAPLPPQNGEDLKKRSTTIQLPKDYMSYSPDLDRLPSVTIRPSRSPHRYHTGSAIGIGTRKSQQDAMRLSAKDAASGGPVLLGVICDGMGGMENGEIASNLAADALLSDFGFSFDPADIPAFLEQEARKADGLIQSTLSEGRDSSAGTTMVAVVIAGNKLHWLSVGDSRIYILRQREIVQVTRDHNFRLVLMEQVARGEITEAAMEDNRDKEALISYLGMGGVELMDINRQPFVLRDGDIVLLCSDGLTKSLTDAQILNFILDSSDNLDSCAELLVRKAYECRTGAHQDNTAVIVIRYANE